MLIDNLLARADFYSIGFGVCSKSAKGRRADVRDIAGSFSTALSVAEEEGVFCVCLLFPGSVKIEERFAGKCGDGYVAVDQDGGNVNVKVQGSVETSREPQ